MHEDPTMQLEGTIETTPHQKTTGIGDCKESPVQMKDLEQNRFLDVCLLYTSPSPRDQRGSRMPSSA